MPESNGMQEKSVRRKQVLILAFLGVVMAVEAAVIVSYSGGSAGLAKLMAPRQTEASPASPAKPPEPVVPVPKVFESGEILAAPVVSPVDDVFGDSKVIDRMKKSGLR